MTSNRQEGIYYFLYFQQGSGSPTYSKPRFAFANPFDTDSCVPLPAAPLPYIPLAWIGRLGVSSAIIDSVTGFYYSHGDKIHVKRDFAMDKYANHFSKMLSELGAGSC